MSKIYRIARHRFHPPGSNNEIMTVTYDMYTEEEMFVLLLKQPDLTYHSIDETGHTVHYIRGVCSEHQLE